MKPYGRFIGEKVVATGGSDEYIVDAEEATFVEEGRDEDCGVVNVTVRFPLMEGRYADGHGDFGTVEELVEGGWELEGGAYFAFEFHAVGYE